MFERFTGGARASVVDAQVVARDTGSEAIGPEQILAGLLGPAGVLAARALTRAGVSPDELRSALPVGAATGGGRRRRKRVPFTPRAKKVLELSAREAVRGDSERITTAHILLGMLSEGDGVPARVLSGAELDLDGLRAVVAEVLAEEPAAEDDVGPSPRESRSTAPVGDVPDVSVDSVPSVITEQRGLLARLFGRR